MQKKDTLKTEEIKQKVAAPVTPPPATSNRKVEKKQEVVVWDKLKGGPIKTLNGVPYTGAVVKYQRNGQKELEGNFFNGQRSGKWVYYDKFGNVKDVRYY